MNEEQRKKFEEEGREHEEKKKKYEADFKLVAVSWESNFGDVLNRLVDDEHWDVLDFYSPVTGKELYDSLTELWRANFYIHYQKTIIEESGRYGVEIKKRSVAYSSKKRSDGKTMSSEEFRLASDVLFEKFHEKRKIKRELRLQGEGCHSFWFTEKWEKLGKMVSGHMMEAVKKRAEGEMNMAAFSILHGGPIGEEEGKVITKEQREKNLEAAGKKIKAWMDSMLAIMKEVTAGFVKDLEDVQQKVKHDLEGWRYHWKRFSEVAVPILALSTFALAALRIWLAVKNGELSVNELFIAVVVVLLVIERGIFSLYRQSK